MAAPDHNRRATLAAAFGAVLGIASQVAGKAARDTIFLSHFPVTALPALLISSSVVSIAAALWMARAMARKAPGRLVPIANVVSAVLLLVEWWGLGRFPHVAAVAVYVHQSVIGALLVSGFWSLVNECFDPRAARRAMGTIGTGSTLGGLVGALVAERTAAYLGVNAILPLLAGVQLLSAWRLRALVRISPPPDRTRDEPLPVGDAVRSLGKVALLRHLVFLVVIGTVVAALLDYVFKARAVQSFSGVELARFFAAYYGGVGLLTAAVQWTVGRYALESWGIARTIGSLPAAVAALAAAAVAAPGVATVVAARGVENVLRNSLYRQAYEVLYTPLPARERRSTKTVVDVGVERIGDAIGGALVGLGLVAGAAAPPLLLGGAAVISLAGVWVATRVQQSYVEALERGLVARAIELDLEEVHDRTSRATLMLTLHRGVPSLPEVSAGAPRTPSVPPPQAVLHPLDPVLARAAELTSGDAARVRAALQEPLPPALVAHAIPLLAWDDVARAVTEALGRVAARSVGQLSDALLDPDEEFAVRRRLPRVIAAGGGPRAAQGLQAALGDARFEVRFRSARALARLRMKNPELPVDPDQLMAGIRRELAVDELAWKDLQILDANEERDVEQSGSSPLLVDELLEDRVNRGLEHVFTLLTLTLPPEPIRIAFRALHTQDRSLRGTALEYLEQVLPPDVRNKLWPRIEADVSRPAATRPREQVMTDLLGSQAAIQVSLQALTAGDGKRRRGRS